MQVGADHFTVCTILASNVAIEVLYVRIKLVYLIVGVSHSSYTVHRVMIKDITSHKPWSCMCACMLISFL